MPRGAPRTVVDALQMPSTPTGMSQKPEQHSWSVPSRVLQGCRLGRQACMAAGGSGRGVCRVAQSGFKEIGGCQAVGKATLS